MSLFISQLWQNPTVFFLTLVTLVFSICFHEFCHAQCALWMGDSTAADAGHLTLNPLRQMGWGSLFMLLIAGIAWGAVPVNPERLRSRHSCGPLVTALAGPAANFLLALVGWLLLGATLTLVPVTAGNRVIFTKAVSFFAIFGIYNIVLMLFNLIPAPGLDGWAVIDALFPGLRKTSSESVKGTMVFLIFAALMGVHYLFTLAEMIMKTSPVFFHWLFHS